MGADVDSFRWSCREIRWLPEFLFDTSVVINAKLNFWIAECPEFHARTIAIALLIALAQDLHTISDLTDLVSEAVMKRMLWTLYWS